MDADFDVDGATLRYRIQGKGPLLALLPGGDGGIDRCDDLVAELSSDYAVLTYNRRGIGTSTVNDDSVHVSVAAHAKDLRLLLDAIGNSSASIVGSSFGGLISLELAATCSEAVQVVIAHEAPLLGVLDASAQFEAHRQLARVEEAFAQSGPAAALGLMAVLTGAGSSQREPHVAAPPPVTPQRMADLKVVMTNDLAAIRGFEFRHDRVDQLRRGVARVVPAIGADTPAETIDHQTTVALAAALGVDPVTFPGGHNGITSHPRAWAQRLHNVLTERSS